MWFGMTVRNKNSSSCLKDIWIMHWDVPALMHCAYRLGIRVSLDACIVYLP